MERRAFLRSCCAALGLPLFAGLLHRCKSLHRVEGTYSNGRIRVARSVFVEDPEQDEMRDRVLLHSEQVGYPIVLQKLGPKAHRALLLRCTHQRCALNTGGGIYTCPCHGSAFSRDGKVLEGPATDPLPTLQTETDHESITVHIP